MRSALAMTALAAVLAAGCSRILMTPAPPPSPPELRTWPECTENCFWPVVDTGVAALGASGALYFATAGSDDDLATVGIIVESAIALGFAWSAWWGWRERSECVRAREEYRRAAVAR